MTRTNVNRGPVWKGDAWRAVAAVALLLAVAGLLAFPSPVRADVAGAGAPPFTAGSWTFVDLPDTQAYAESYPEILDAQTRWIAENRQARHIAFVVQCGDIVNQNTPEQWERVRRSFQRLDGVVPYAIALGNHDYEGGGYCSTRGTLLNTYWSLAQLRSLPTFGGVFEEGRLENSYHLFTAGGRKWLVLALEFGPRDAVVAWANRILDKHPERRAIIIAHAYLFTDNTRLVVSRGLERTPETVKDPGDQYGNPHGFGVAGLPGGVNDGEELWQKCLSLHRNVALVICGHIVGTGTGYLASVGKYGNVVHQMLADYQHRPLGGEGYLRLLEFLPDGHTVKVKTYSPHLGRSLTDPTQEFTFDLQSATPASR